jgi:hypothetical protein
MDAKTFNQCEAKVISIIEKIIGTLELDANIKFVVRKDGGIRNIIRLDPKTPVDRWAVEIIKAGIFGGIITTIVSQAITKSPTEITPPTADIQTLDNIINQPLPQNYDKNTKTPQQMANAILSNLHKINDNDEIKKDLQKDQSELYRKLKSDNSATAISVETIKPLDNGEVEYVEHAKVERQQFNDFILDTEHLEPLVIDDAVIEIISPVLTDNGRYKWRGAYNGSAIDFYMSDKDVKQNITNGFISFKANMKIIGKLEIHRKRNQVGEEAITNYVMKDVFDIIEVEGKVIKTNKGVKKQNYKNTLEQLALDFDETPRKE